MLSKLLKKDLSSTCRFFIPLLCGYAIAAVLGKILFEIVLSQSNMPYNNTGFFDGITIFSVFYMIIFIIYLVGCYLMTFVFVVYDFYKTMVSDYGYLTHTLPVKTSTLIWSKVLISAFWHILVYLIIGLSFMLLFVGHMRDIPIIDLIYTVINKMDTRAKVYSFYTALGSVIQLFNQPLMFFSCIAIGQLWKNHRILGAIFTYIGMYVFMQILSTIVMVLIGNNFFNGYMIYSTLFSLITTVLFFLLTNYILSNKLNLE